MVGSYLRSAKQMSTTKDAELYSDNGGNGSPGYSSTIHDENIRVVVPEQPINVWKPDFVIQSFQNSVKTKAMRDARRSGSVNPYIALQSRQSKLNIVVNPFD